MKDWDLWGPLMMEVDDMIEAQILEEKARMPKPYYERSGIVIYNGKCEEILPYLSGSDVTITDPPYESEAHTLQRRVQHEANSNMQYGRSVAVETLPFGPITPELRDLSAKLIAEKTRTWTLIFCQIEGAPIWRQSCELHGLNYRRTCIWVKPDGMPQYSGDRPGMGYETLLAMHAAGASTWNGGGGGMACLSTIRAPTASRTFIRQRSRFLS